MTLPPSELRWKQMVWLNKEQLFILSWALEEEVYTQTHQPNRKHSALYPQAGTQGALPQYRDRDLAPGLGQVQEGQFTSAGLHDSAASLRAAGCTTLHSWLDSACWKKKKKKQSKVIYVNTCKRVSTFAPPTPSCGSEPFQNFSLTWRSQSPSRGSNWPSIHLDLPVLELSNFSMKCRFYKANYYSYWILVLLTCYHWKKKNFF